MKTNASIQNPFLFNPEISFAGKWPTVRQAKPRPRALTLAMETQIDYKQEFACGVVLLLCLLSGLAAVIAQFAAA